jgi:hypothetical protein
MRFLRFCFSGEVFERWVGEGGRRSLGRLGGQATYIVGPMVVTRGVVAKYRSPPARPEIRLRRIDFHQPRANCPNDQVNDSTFSVAESYSRSFFDARIIISDLLLYFDHNMRSYVSQCITVSMGA